MTERTAHLRPIPRSDLQTPFVALPDPATLFTCRANRSAVQAERHELAPYLRFVAGVAQAQAALLPHLPNQTPIADDIAERAAAHGMPLIDRARLIDDKVLAETIERFLAAIGPITMPAPAAAALARLRSETAAWRQHLRNALEDAVAGDIIAEHLFIAAALQLHATRLAALLSPNMLRPVGTGVCPACGGAPVACVLVDRPAAHNARYCVCATCATQWNTVRVSCVLCGRTDGIAYYHIGGRDDGISAETCESCRGYVKFLSQVKYPDLDPVVDDVASLALDLKLQDAGWRRGGVNPFLTGY